MEVPECPVCLLVYNGEEAVPRVLSCGHTLCEPCLQQLPPYLANSIKCPECNQVAKFPAQGPSGLPKNIDLLRLIPHSNPMRAAQRRPPSSSIKNPSDGSLVGLPTDGSCSIWKNFTVPSDVIQVLEDGRDSNVSLGVASSSWSCLRKNQKVGLLPLLIGDGGSSGSVIRLTYGLRILKILDGLSKIEKDELTFLLKASATGRRVCKLYGFWMDSEGRVFLVSEKFRQENRIILDGLNGCLKEPVGCSVDSKDVMIRFSSLALEICEAIMDLHSQGFVVGFLSPLCFGFDEYGHVFIDLSNSLLEKKRIQDNFLGSWVCSEGDKIDALVIKRMFISPEAFKRLYSKNLGVGTLKTNLNNSDEKLEASFSCKSDVWSLACMLINLILEDAVFDVFLSGYYGSCFAESRESIGVGVGDYVSCIKRELAGTACRFGAKFEELHHVLLKCLDHDVNARPQMSDVWICLKAITSRCGSDDLKVQFQHENVEWCLMLGHLYSLHKCYNSSWQRDKGPMLDKVDQVVLIDGSGLNSELCSNVNSGHTLEGCSGVKVAQTFDHNVVDQVTNDGGKTITLRGHLDCITGLAIGGGYLLSSSFDKTVRVWSLKDFCHVRTVNSHAHRVTAIVVLDMDEPLYISADSGGSIYIWSLDPQLGQEPLKNWHEHSDWRYSGVHSLAVSGLDVLYSGSGDKSIKAWSLKDYSLICAMTGHKSVVSSLSVNDGILYSGSWDGTVRLWWISDHSPLMVLEDNPPIPISSVLSLSVNQDIVVAGHENGLLKIWSNGAFVKSVKLDDGPILSIAMNGKWLFSATWKKMINIQELCKDESRLDAKAAGCIDCDSVATSLLYYGGNLFVGFSNKDIKEGCIIVPHAYTMPEAVAKS